MQTFAIVIGLVQLDFLWRRWRAEIVDVNVPQTVQLRFKGAEYRIVGVARVAGLLGRDAMVLKMCGSQIGGIVNVEALSVRFHNVAGQAKLGALGSLHLACGAHTETKNGQKKEH